jgi:hypothetical protein
VAQVKLCCTKLIDGTTCPQCATREIQLGARGLTFKVPICETHFKMLPAASKSPEQELRDVLGGLGLGKAKR